jgi:hypothetical protein
MKTSVCLLAVLVSACSFAVDVPALPDAAYADTEGFYELHICGWLRSRYLV